MSPAAFSGSCRDHVGEYAPRANGPAALLDLVTPKRLRAGERPSFDKTQDRF